MSPEGRRVVAYAAYSESSRALRAQIMHPGQATAPLVDLSLASVTGSIGGTDVAMAKYGQFIAAWDYQPTLGSSAGIRGQYVSWRGEPIGPMLTLSNTPVRSGTVPVIATAGYGSRYALAWEESDPTQQHSRLFARLLDSNGVPISAPIRIDEVGEDYAPPADIAMKENGESLIAFGGPAVAQPSHLMFIQVRVLSSEGVPGELIRVADSQSLPNADLAYVDYPSIVVLADGGFAVAWREFTYRSNSQNSSRVLARVFNADHSPRGEAFEVAATAAGAMLQVQSIALAADWLGRLSVAWTENPRTGGASLLKARQFDLDGIALSAAFVVDGNDTDTHFFPAIASDADGDLTIGWTRMTPSYQITSMLRRFRGAQAADVSLSANVSSTLIRPGERVSLSWQSENHSLPEDSNTFPLYSVTGTKVDVELPTGAIVDSLDDYGWTCAGNTLMSCQLNNLLSAAGEAQFHSLIFGLPNTAGVYPVSVRMTADQADLSAGNDEVTLNVRVADVEPDPISFVDIDDVARGTWMQSGTVLSSGYDLPVTASVLNGEYRINNGPWTTVAADVAPGSQLQLRHLSASSFSTTVTTELNLGGRLTGFSSTTLARDISPDPFTFVAVSDVARDTVITSSEIQVNGINDAAPISVQNGHYSINGGAFTDQSGSILNGDRIRLQHLSAQEFETATDSTVVIGDVSAAFRSTTLARDITPDPFAFSAVSNVARNTLITSNEIQVSGINDATPISVQNGRYSVNGGAFTDQSGVVVNGDRIRLQHVSAPELSSTTETIVTVGTVNGAFRSTTEAPDSTPNSFTFSDVADARRGKPVESNTVQITGVNVPVTVSISGGEFSINGGGFSSAARIINAGDTLQLRTIASSTKHGVVNVTVAVGSLSVSWKVTSGRTG